MRGQILGVDRTTGDAQVTGEDGNRYRFRRDDWADPVGPAVGAMVDFDVSDGRAVSVYRVPGSVPAPQQDHRPRRVNDRNKIVAALLAFFLGPLGVHRFYLGRTGSGIVMLILTCTIVGLLVTGIWAFVDFIRYLVMPEAEFEHRYSRLVD
ncbi:MAG: TM2 domain-containing protein [Pseudomonadota bacterium]